MDKSNQQCSFINENGADSEYLEGIAQSMGGTPYETAMIWERDLLGSNCLILDDLSELNERDPVWYASLQIYGIRSIILYAVQFHHNLVGFIWAANYETFRTPFIRETLELTSFLIGAVIANQQLLSKLEEKSTVDFLTQVNNRNTMNERVDAFVSGTTELPAQLRALADNTSDVSFVIGTVHCTGEFDICKAMQAADEKIYKDKEAYYKKYPEKDRRKRIRE